MPTDRWYASIENGRHGPMTFAELVHLAEVGRLQPTDHVWQPDYPEWVEARSVPHLGVLSAEVPVVKPPNRVWPSDTLPLWVLSGVVLCFVLHFGQRRFGEEQALSAKSSPGEGRGGPALVATSTKEVPSVEVRICNHTETPKLYTSIAYYDNLRGDWVARGWYPVGEGKCLTAMRNVVPPVFVYAESKDGTAFWGGEGEEAAKFCLDGEGGFVLPQKTCDSAAAPESLRHEDFRELKLQGSGGVQTWELSD